MAVLPGTLVCLAASDDPAGVLPSLLLAVVAGTFAYTAAFGWLSLRLRRPVVVGMLYIVLWEGSIATFAPSSRWLSIGAYTRAIARSGLPATVNLNVPAVGLLSAFIVLAIFTIATVVLCARRLARVELP